jgi:hypothetical protein
MDHLLKKSGFLGFSASNVVFGPMRLGAIPRFARGLLQAPACREETKRRVGPAVGGHGSNATVMVTPW